MRARGETWPVTRGGSTLRVGFIGAGFSARVDAEAYHQVRGVDVVLTRVAAARPERAAQFAEEFGVSAVAASAEEVLAAPDVDVVDLCVPTIFDAPLAIKAAQACHGRWGRDGFTSGEIPPVEVLETRGRSGSSSPRGEVENSDRRGAAAGRVGRPVVPLGDPAAGRCASEITRCRGVRRVRRAVDGRVSR